MKKHSFHKACKELPDMSEDEFAALVKDIRENGLQQPILRCQGEIIDGRNRYEACLKASVPPRFTDIDVEDPEAFVLSMNIYRRHLSVKQRAQIAAKLINTTHGGDRSKSPIGDLKTVAKKLKISPRSVSRARTVELNASETVKKKVASGEVPLHKAAQVASLPKSEQVNALNSLPAKTGMLSKLRVLDMIEEVESVFLEPHLTYDGRTVKAFAKMLRERLA